MGFRVLRLACLALLAAAAAASTSVAPAGAAPAGAAPAGAMPPGASAAGAAPAAAAASSAPQADIAAEVQRLRAALARAVPQTVARGPQADAAWTARAQQAIATSGFTIDHPQLIVVVDRSPHVQELRIILAQPGNLPWQVIGGSKVSTGQPNRYAYFITPTGVFLHLGDILDYRAEGTFNENHIRGLGLKGMRVWDFGWQTAQRGWITDHDHGEIRLLMHATDPTYLEQRIGRPASKGCVRIPAAMNRFLDLHGVLDAGYEREAPDDARVRALLLPDRQPSKFAGEALVIVDSAAPG